MIFSSKTNDGTLVISNSVGMPMQGTLIGDDKTGKVIAKGIIRPQFTNRETGDVEPEGIVDAAAFGKQVVDAKNAKFYRLREVGKERAGMSLQTVYFATKDPAATIAQDNKRLESLTALDFLARDDARKVKAGVSPALLADALAPWNLVRQFDVTAVRATVYGSTMVPAGMEVAPYKYGETEADRVEQAFASISKNWKHSSFMLLPQTAEALANKLGCKIYELKGKWFLVHRDPALPDGTSLYTAQFAGVLHWSNDCSNNHGIIFNPLDPYWKAAGGDYDGDSATIVVPTLCLLPKGALSRPDYLIDRKRYTSEDIGEQMREAAADTVQGLLGPLALSTARLIERGACPDSLRSLAAGAIQASVQAKKHAVDTEVVVDVASGIFVETAFRSYQKAIPYISDYLNALNNAVGADAKIAAWKELVAYVKLYTPVSDIETAMIERIMLIDGLFGDVEFFRSLSRVELPRRMVEAAKAQTTDPTLIDAVSELRKEYAQATRSMVEQPAIEDEHSVLKPEDTLLEVDLLKRIRAEIELAIYTGMLDGKRWEPKDVHTAMVAYGPPRLVAKYCPPEVFERLGQETTRTFVALIGHGWETRDYLIEELNAIPTCKNDTAGFCKGKKHVHVTVVSLGPQTTRVMLTAC